MTGAPETSDLNIENFPALLDYLRRRNAISPEEQPEFRNLEGGVSNRVVLVRPETGSAFVLKQALEKLRVQVDWFCTPARIEREALALFHLCTLAPPGTIPAFIFQDAEHHLLAMAEVPDPKQNWKQLLLGGHLVPDHAEQFGILLGSIHRRSALESEQLTPIFGDRAVFEALRLEPYYRYTASRVPEAAPFLYALIADTLACRLSLVHGDYSPKNILVHGDRLVLLDFEVVHFGDPSFDIGFSMAHFLGKANHLPPLRQRFVEFAIRYWQSYARSGLEGSRFAEIEQRAIRHTLACSLARVAGRSPLEYLTPPERTLQSAVVLKLMKEPPTSMPNLITSFATQLSCLSSNA